MARSKSNYHNLLILRLKLTKDPNDGNWTQYLIELPKYNWKKHDPNDWTESANYTISNFIEEYTKEAGYGMIKGFEWCFAYVDKKYKNTIEYDRRLKVLGILDL